MTSPQVTVSPAHGFGRPEMRRLPTEMLADMYWAHGETDLLAADGYDLTRHELLVALWFEATQGAPRNRRRWKAWGAEVSGPLWSTSTLDPELVPLPPRAGRE